MLLPRQRRKPARGANDTGHARSQNLNSAVAIFGTDHLARKLKALGRDARLIPAQYVRPCSKAQKNDFPRRRGKRRGAAAPGDEVRGDQDGVAKSSELTFLGDDSNLER